MASVAMASIAAAPGTIMMAGILRSAVKTGFLQALYAENATDVLVELRASMESAKKRIIAALAVLTSLSLPHGIFLLLKIEHLSRQANRYRSLLSKTNQ